MHPDPNTHKHHPNTDCASASEIHFVQSQNKTHQAACRVSQLLFCFVSIHTSLAFTTHKPLLPMWLLYTQLAQCATTVRYNTSTDGSIPVLSCKLLLVRDTSNQTLFFCLRQISLKPFMQWRWHLASRCARDVNERNGEGSSIFSAMPVVHLAGNDVLTNDGSR